jgi:putative restriction endonuclease
MGEYAASSLEIERLLRASHIKPWRDADNHERVDIFNGLIRGPAYDAALMLGSSRSTRVARSQYHHV